MNIEDLREYLFGIDEIAIIDKVIEIKSVVYHVIGIVRHENSLQLLILQDYSIFDAKGEHSKLKDCCDNYQKPVTGNIPYF